MADDGQRPQADPEGRTSTRSEKATDQEKPKTGVPGEEQRKKIRGALDTTPSEDEDAEAPAEPRTPCVPKSDVPPATAAAEIQPRPAPAAEKPAPPRKAKRRKKRKKDAPEAQLLGRREVCHSIKDIAPRMLKMVMTRVASSHLKSTKGLSEDQLREELVRSAPQIADSVRVRRVLSALDPQRHRRLLKGIIVFDVLLQQERYALPTAELRARVLEYEQEIVAEGARCQLLDPKAMEHSRLFAYETYNVVLDAAWRHEDTISVDEANLLSELRRRLGITLRDHRLLEAKMGRFPKRKCALHSVDEIEDAKRQLHKEGILWTFRDEDGTDIDAVPAEIMAVIRGQIAQIELQKTNFLRLLNNKAWANADFRTVLRSSALDTRGNRAEMAERVLASRLMPSQMLEAQGIGKLRALCREVGLVSYGNKSQVIKRLLGFYDNLTFKPVVERDERAQWYAAYELLAARKYSELKAQGLIEKQEDVDKAFEKATDFLFEKRLRAGIEQALPVKSPDGKIYLPGKQVVLWDCKSDERAVNLQDHLESQFDGYMRTEAREGHQVLYFLVIGPRFTPKSLTVARKYKMATNWDVPLVTASALKRMGEKWHGAKAEQPFPLGLLNLTDMIDDDRADELLSLVL